MTVIPPRGIWATVPSHTASATLRTQPGRADTLRALSQTTSVSTIDPNAITRLPNSMNAWPPFSGNGVEPHRGQLSHPSPDAVSRTTAPVVTTTSSNTAEKTATRRNRDVDD